MSDNSLYAPCNHCGSDLHGENTCPDAPSSLAAMPGSVTPDALIVAFVQGAKWWEYHQTGATMWASDQDQAEGHAEEMARNGTLGKSPNESITTEPART